MCILLHKEIMTHPLSIMLSDRDGDFSHSDIKNP